MCCQRGTRILFVNLHLRNQRLDRIEFFLVAQVLDEVDVDVLAIDVAIEIEQAPACRQRLSGRNQVARHR